MAKQPYTKDGRLADVLALIQVLALDERTYRSESGLSDELQGKPSSSDSWQELAADHPEFFRVAKEKRSPIALVARHVTPEDDEGAKPLAASLMHRLLETAIELHDRQVSAAERWKAWIPALAAAVGGFAGALAKGLFN